MPSKSKKDRRKEEDRCRDCGKVILESLGDWIHVDTGKRESDTPVRHPAYPRSRKKSK